MKRKILLICVAVIGVIILFAWLAWTPVFMESTSPDGMYMVQVQTRSGWELLNAPEHITITIKKKSSLQRATIYTLIHNDDDPISPEENIRIVWEPNQLVIILLGYEQPPEIITVSLEKGFPYEQHQFDLSQDVSNAILEKYGIMQGGKTIQLEKTPQQVLEEQPIDDTHDAFLVDTGGSLGTLLVTVEWDEANKQYDYDALLHFAVWDLAHMDTPLQTMETYSAAFHWSEVADANFDGYQDFGYGYSQGSRMHLLHYWLWDEGQAQFIYYAPLAEISDPVFDEQRQVVTSRTGGNGSGVDTFFRWMDGELTLVRKIEMHYPDYDGTQFVTVDDLIDGQMTEVYRTEWDWREMKETAWEMYQKWYDLDYHGESMEGP